MLLTYTARASVQDSINILQEHSSMPAAALLADGVILIDSLVW